MQVHPLQSTRVNFTFTSCATGMHAHWTGPCTAVGRARVSSHIFFDLSSCIVARRMQMVTATRSPLHCCIVRKLHISYNCRAFRLRARVHPSRLILTSGFDINKRQTDVPFDVRISGEAGRKAMMLSRFFNHYFGSFLLPYMCHMARTDFHTQNEQCEDKNM